MNYRQALLKRRIECALVYPMVLIGRALSVFIKPPINTQCFLIFPSADLGGAPKVNADITLLLKNEHPLIVFSKKPKNNGFLNLFQYNETQILDLHQAIDHKAWHWLNMIWRGILSAWINAAESPVVLGGECMYFYKLLPWLKPHVRVVEVSHLDTWLNYNQAFINRIDCRITSTPKLQRTLLAQYATSGVPDEYGARIHFVDNWVDIPNDEPMPATPPLKVLFVGRGAPQKRVHLIARIAETMLRAKRPVHFTFVGDVDVYLNQYLRAECTCIEKISDPKELHKVYNASHVLLLTSAYEGLPIVVMDMMVRGRVVLSTAVDGIPDYVHHQENGLLIRECFNEDRLCEEAIALLENLIQHPEQLQHLGQAAQQDATKRFSQIAFEKAYNALLFPARSFNSNAT